MNLVCLEINLEFGLLQLMPYFVMETLSDYPGVAGLFVCCVFSASLSTLSSGFNALAAVTWDDFLSRTRLGNLEEKHVMNCLISPFLMITSAIFIDLNLID